MNTDFTETEALLAVMNDDQDEARQLVTGMFDDELAEYVISLKKLVGIAEDVYYTRTGRWM